MVRRPIKLILLLVCVLTASGARAGDPAPFEGRLRIETEHFVIIFEPRDRAAANYVASAAEDAYMLVASSYGSYPDKIYCVLDGRSDLYASAYFPLPAHIRLSVHGPTWPEFGPRSGDWLKTVLTHELTHNVQLTRTSGLFYALSKVFGQGLNAIPATFLPSWAAEGPAVLFETLFTTGGRGDSEHFEMLSTAKADDFFSYSKAGSTTVFGPHSRPYVAGYLMAEYFHRVYGADALQNIHREFLAFPFFGPGRAIRKVTGRPVREIFASVVEEVKARSDVHRNKTGAALITPEVYGNWYLPHITNRGWIMYRYTHDLPAALVLYDPKTGDEEVLKITSLTDPSSFSADSSGEIVVYSSRMSSQTGEEPVVYSDLYLLRTANHTARQITENERLWHPAVNPEGEAIVAVAGLGPESCLVAVDLDSGSLRTLYRKAGSTVYNPVFSVDGKSLFFAMNSAGMQDIWMLPYPVLTEQFDPAVTAAEVNTAKARPVTGPDRDAEFFPRVADEKIVYASDKGGSLAVYAQPAAGGLPVLIAEDPVGAYAGLLDGAHVVYATYTNRGYALKRAALPDFAAPAPPADHGSSTGEPEPTTRGSGGEADSRDTATSTYLTEKTYIDVPRLLFWLPLPVSYDQFNNFALGYGAGVFIKAGSILRSNSVSAIMTYDWTELQPAFDIGGSIGIGPASLSYRAYYGYNHAEDGFFLRRTGAYLQAAYPLIYNYRYPEKNQLVAGAAVGYDTAAAYFDSFGFLENPKGATVTHLLQTSGIIRYTVAGSGARKDFFEPFLLSTWVDAGVSFPLEHLKSTAVWIGSGAKAQAPILFKHHVAGIGFDAVYSPRSDGVAPRPSPRSGLPPSSGEGTLSLLAALDYRFHIALLDLPLPYGYSLDHLAGGIYVESAMLADASGLTIDRYLYPGIELFTNFGSVSHFPVGIGVGFRIDPLQISSFKLLSDTRIYLTAGTGGFSPFLDAAGNDGYLVNR